MYLVVKHWSCLTLQRGARYNPSVLGVQPFSSGCFAEVPKVNAAIDDMSIYEGPGQKLKKEALNLRAPESLRAMLNDTVKLWKMLAEARGEDADQIDLSFVCLRLLKVGSDTAFGEFGVKLIPEEGEDKGKYRPALPSSEKDERGKPVLTVVSPAEWKHLAKAIATVVGK